MKPKKITPCQNEQKTTIYDHYDDLFKKKL